MMILLSQYEENKNERKKEMNALTQRIVLETIQELILWERGSNLWTNNKRLKEKYPDLPLYNLSNRLIRLKKWKDIRKDINDNKYYLN